MVWFVYLGSKRKPGLVVSEVNAVMNEVQEGDFSLALLAADQPWLSLMLTSGDG